MNVFLLFVIKSFWLVVLAMRFVLLKDHLYLAFDHIQKLNVSNLLLWRDALVWLERYEARLRLSHHELTHEWCLVSENSSLYGLFTHFSKL